MTRLAVSVPEAAMMLGLSRSSMYAAVDRGEIRSVKVGSRILVPIRGLEELMGYIEQDTQGFTNNGADGADATDSAGSSTSSAKKKQRD